MSNDYDAGGWATEQDWNTPAQPAAAPRKSPWEGRTATNPKTGQKLILQGGQWVALPSDAAPPPANAAQAKLRVMTADQPMAGDEINQLMTQIDPKTGKNTRPNLLANTVQDLPFIGNEGAANWIRDPAQQTLEAAGQMWITNAAHALSGARIGNEQLQQLLRAYIPKATDSDQVIAFKAAQRQRLEQGIREASGMSGEMSPEAANALTKVLLMAPQAEQERAAIKPFLSGAEMNVRQPVTSTGTVGRSSAAAASDTPVQQWGRDPKTGKPVRIK